MRVGRTIAEERERIESESERLAARELTKRREALQTAILVVAIVALGVLGVISAKSLMSGVNEGVETETVSAYKPTVEVIDESGGGLTRKMSEFIGMVEEDFSAIGYKVTRAAVPTGMMREVDVYIASGGDDGGTGVGEVDGGEADADGGINSGELPYYFKMNVDRGSAVSVEDAERMVRYLQERGLTPSYVDVRVEGKAFYR